MGNLTDYARRELRGLITSESAMDKAMSASDVLALIVVFSEQGHSGMSAPICISLFNRLARFKPLGPLTGTDDEWNEVEDGKLWQNNRRSSVFKDQTGKAWDIDAYVLEDEKDVRFTNKMSGDMSDVKFPYTVPDKPVVVKVREVDGKWVPLS